MRTEPTPGFLQSLPDIRLSRLVTPRVLNVVYDACLLAMAVAAVVWIVLVAASDRAALLKLALAAGTLPVYLLVAFHVRIAIEGVIVLLDLDEDAPVSDAARRPHPRDRRVTRHRGLLQRR
jgi:Domain of unknown function (DUF4282)